MKELSTLQDTIGKLGDEFSDNLVFMCGNTNASISPRDNNKRDSLFNYFLEDNRPPTAPINHHTYHHFTNNGSSYSSIDVIIFSRVSSDVHPSSITESVSKVLCSKTNPAIDSSHDALISVFSLPLTTFQEPTSGNIQAPRITLTRHKILWSDAGIIEYQNLLLHALPNLHSEYSATVDPEVASVLFKVTNHILDEAAKATNKHIEVGKVPKPKKARIPPEVRNAQKAKDEALKDLNIVTRNVSTTDSEKNDALTRFKNAKSLHQSVIRRHRVAQEITRDNDLLGILSKQPRDIFKKFRQNKSSQTSKVKSLLVGNKVYTEEKVADGFFDSISELKTLSEVTATSFERFAEDHRHIIEIMKAGAKVPKLSEKQAEDLLKRIRPAVSDIFSITASHYLNGGIIGIRHFQFLLNTILETIELACIDELNHVHAVILHKGHKKDRSLASSYRTISSCPFIAKAADIYLGDLSKDDWRACQAPTQFQGPGMSHELASLLLTSAIQDSMNSSSPLFVLLLDARSAFDLVLRKILIRRLFLDTTPDQRIRYWDLRLANRTTFCQWENETMGPIDDQLGVEQGGPNGSEHYKIYNNEQLCMAQDSGLGTAISGLPVAAVGQADDTALLSNNIHQLQHLLDLSILYCNKHQVKLSAGKTKLLVYSKNETDYTKYVKLLSPLHIGDTQIMFATEAEHVGVLRSLSGNLPHIHQRIVNHKKALGQILRMGMSRRHRANPIAALRAEQVFASPVLFSGMASLLLSRSDIDILAKNVKETTESLLKLHPKTPEPVVFFLAGRLPGEALLHLKQLTLFGMICLLHGNILNNIARQLLTTANQRSKNWFANIRDLCFMYNLPHPLLLLKSPPTKESFKTLCKANVTDFWQQRLREHSASLEEKSLRYFKPQFMSLTRPHPLLTWATTSYQVNKSIVTIRMLSGRFRCGSLLRHFYQHVSGVCELCHGELEDLPHILLPKCPLLLERAHSLSIYFTDKLSQSLKASAIANEIMSSEDDYLKMQFFLDPTVIPVVIAAAQTEPDIIPLILSATTTWCYSLNRERMKLLGK